MKHSSKHRESVSNMETAEAVAKQTAREFANVEELLRADAAQVEVPETVKLRLAESIAQEMPEKASPWWRRIFGG